MRFLSWSNMIVSVVVCKSSLFDLNSSINFVCAKDKLCIDLDLQSQAPQRKPTLLKQKFPAAPNSVKKRKVKAGVSISDTLNTQSGTPALSGES